MPICQVNAFEIDNVFEQGVQFEQEKRLAPLIGIRSTKPWVQDDLFDARPAGTRKIEIDAAFVPTLGTRRNLYDLTERLAKRCSKVFVLPSNHVNIDRTTLRKQGVGVLLTEDMFHGMPEWQREPGCNHAASHDIRFDLPAKRNLALSCALDRNFRRILLVDDDIEFSSTPFDFPELEEESAFDVAGYYSLDFPDVSAVDYIGSILSGRPPEVSLGGSCICIDRRYFGAYFPYIYNEDWLFLFQVALLGGRIIGLGSVTQLAHKPWSRKARISFEQFGDVIALGLRSMAATRSDVMSYDLARWAMIYDDYASVLAAMIDRAPAPASLRRALETAQNALTQFTASEVADFFRRWSSPIIANE